MVETRGKVGRGGREKGEECLKKGEGWYREGGRERLKGEEC